MIESAVPGTAPWGAAGADLAPGLALVRARHLLLRDPVVRFPLAIGDRPIVSAGEAVAAGAPLAERMAEAALVDATPRSAVAPAGGPDAHDSAGERRSGRWSAVAGATGGELVARVDGRWRMAVGTPVDVLESPADGVVRDVRPGIFLSLAVPGVALAGAHAVGGPARGRLEIAADEDGGSRAGAIDVGRAGTILVLEARADAETLSRARAMGVRGIIVSGLSDKDGRDFAASEARQRASLHRAAPFGVLVLDGALRRSIAEPVLAVLRACAGRDVGIVADPPCLLIGPAPTGLAEPDLVHVRVANGPWVGREGRWEGLAGLRRFRAGAHLEAGRIRFDDGTAAVVPLADLERFA